MIAAGHPRVRAALTALLEDRLYIRTADNKIFIVKTTEGDLAAYALVDPVSRNRTPARRRRTRWRRSAATTGSGDRSEPRSRISDSRAPIRRYRLGAIQDMLRSLDEPTVALLRERKAVETDAGVQTAIDTGLAMADLDGTDTAVRLAAIETLSSRLGSDVRNRLAALVEQSPDGTFVEPRRRSQGCSGKGAVAASIRIERSIPRSRRSSSASASAPCSC